MTSSMEGRPEPLHLYAQHVSDGVVRVVNGEGAIVAEATPVDFVAEAIKALKMMSVDHETSVIIQGVSGNPAYNGALKHHSA